MTPDERQRYAPPAPVVPDLTISRLLMLFSSLFTAASVSFVQASRRPPNQASLLLLALLLSSHDLEIMIDVFQSDRAREIREEILEFLEGNPGLREAIMRPLVEADA